MPHQPVIVVRVLSFKSNYLCEVVVPYKRGRIGPQEKNCPAMLRCGPAVPTTKVGVQDTPRGRISITLSEDLPYRDFRVCTNWRWCKRVRGLARPGSAQPILKPFLISREILPSTLPSTCSLLRPPRIVRNRLSPPHRDHRFMKDGNKVIHIVLVMLYRSTHELTGQSIVV